MTSTNQISDLERELKNLIREETVLIELLRDVRKQITRYKVEELDNSTLQERRNTIDSDSDTAEETEELSIQKLITNLDAAEEINRKKLNLDVNKFLTRDFNTDEEDDEDDEDEDEDIVSNRSFQLDMD